MIYKYEYSPFQVTHDGKTHKYLTGDILLHNEDLYVILSVRRMGTNVLFKTLVVGGIVFLSTPGDEYWECVQSSKASKYSS